MTFKEKDGMDYDEEYLANQRLSNPNKAFIRAENEDDDGYDPYSDRKEYTPLFERDPWA